MMNCHRAVVGILAAGVLALPLATSVSAAAKKPAAKKPAAKKPTAKPAGADAKAGKESFQKEGCTGCHITKDFAQGGKTGPDLSSVGKDKSVADITKYIQHPKSGSVMPAFKGPAKTLADLGAYLGTQKG
jgi:cbb3-type cytochrome oxidase cytochrome c subunit